MVRLSTQCIECLLKKHVNKYPSDAAEETKLLYQQGALQILGTAKKEQSAPEILAEIEALKEKIFGVRDDFSKEKVYFNALMLGKEPEMRKKVRAAEDELSLAASYAMLGNFIDFGAMDSVDEEKLSAMLADVQNMRLDAAELKNLKTDLARAKRLVYLTDNCGEIVMDKLLIETILRLYPTLQVEVIVRGAPVLNDATMEDALQIGLDTLAFVTDNGSAVAGTVLDKISAQAREKIDAADVILAKGQGNFETLRFCGKNIYYLFMCKCIMFAERFGVERFSPMVLNDLRMQ